MEVFKDYAHYYNAFYSGKDYRAEAEQVDGLLKKYGNNVSEIIDFGCGTAQHDIELSKMNYQCTGIDLSTSMIEAARESCRREKADIALSVADVRDFKVERRYDAVISLFHVMSYQTKNSDILSAFRSARGVLERGGILLFDTWYGPGVLSDRPGVRVKEAENERNRLVRIARPSMHVRENTVDIIYEIFVVDKETQRTETVSEVHKMRYFFRPELELLLEEADFELIADLDCRTMEETDNNSWTAYFIARAK